MPPLWVNDIKYYDFLILILKAYGPLFEGLALWLNSSILIYKIFKFPFNNLRLVEKQRV